nr:PREDICTED: pleckstrin homology domain-containing family A member 6 [Struthio camelus australis]
MGEAARVQIPPTQRHEKTDSENIPPSKHHQHHRNTTHREHPKADPDAKTRGEGDGRGSEKIERKPERMESKKEPLAKANGITAQEMPSEPGSPYPEAPRVPSSVERPTQPNGWPYSSPSRPGSTAYPQLDGESVVHRRGFVPRTNPEKIAQRKSSMTAGPPPSRPRLYSPVRSPSARFERVPPRGEEIYAGPATFMMRRSVSSPKVKALLPLGTCEDELLDLQLQRNLEYLDQQMSESETLISMVNRMVENSSPRAQLYMQVTPFPEAYRETLHAYKISEQDTDKLLGKLCEQNKVLREQERLGEQLRAEKESLESALMGTHQELEMFGSQPAYPEKLLHKKESLQNQLISIRVELSQASTALANSTAEYESLESEVSALHDDLWEQLNLDIQWPGSPQERPKSAVFATETKVKMSVEEQIDRMKRHQSGSMKEKRRSLQLLGSQQPETPGTRAPASYKVVRRHRSIHEVDISDLEAALRSEDSGKVYETPREEIARLRKMELEPQHYDVDIHKELSTPDKVLIPERYIELEPDTPLSPEEMKEKQKKVERIKTLIAKSSLQNVVPLSEGEVDTPQDPETQLQEQEKRIEISCALAAEASRRGRMLSAQCATPSPPTSPASPTPPTNPLSSETSRVADSSHFMRV